MHTFKESSALSFRPLERFGAFKRWPPNMSARLSGHHPSTRAISLNAVTRSMVAFFLVSSPICCTRELLSACVNFVDCLFRSKSSCTSLWTKQQCGIRSFAALMIRARMMLVLLVSRMFAFRKTCKLGPRHLALDCSNGFNLPTLLLPPSPPSKSIASTC